MGLGIALHSPDQGKSLPRDQLWGGRAWYFAKQQGTSSASTRGAMQWQGASDLFGGWGFGSDPSRLQSRGRHMQSSQKGRPQVGTGSLISSCGTTPGGYKVSQREAGSLPRLGGRGKLTPDCSSPQPPMLFL